MYVCSTSLVSRNHVFVPSGLYRANRALFPSLPKRFLRILRKTACYIVTVIHTEIRMFWTSPAHYKAYVRVSTWTIRETCLVDHDVFVILYENYDVERSTDVLLKWTILTFSNCLSYVLVTLVLLYLFEYPPYTYVKMYRMKCIRGKSWRPESPAYTLLSKNMFVN